MRTLVCTQSVNHTTEATMFQGFLAYTCEMDFACLYALRRPYHARKAAQKAASLAITARRPDLAYRANALLAAL